MDIMDVAPGAQWLAGMVMIAGSLVLLKYRDRFPASDQFPASDILGFLIFCLAIGGAWASCESVGFWG